MRVLLLLSCGFAAVSAEFTTVGMMDGGQIDYYDSNIRKKIPKTEWIKKIDADDPDYWTRGTQNLQGAEESFRVGVANLMKRFNQTEGFEQVPVTGSSDKDNSSTGS